MKKKTLEALKKSIAHWEDNTKVKKIGDAKTATKDCALCDLFFDLGCGGCPVFEFTQQIYCHKTAYHEAVKYLKLWEYKPHHEEFAESFRSAAEDEVKFLKMLLKLG